MYFSKYYKPWHLTPASSEWPIEQLTKELCGQSVRLLSLPVQSTLSRWIGPAPKPKWARPKDTAPVWWISRMKQCTYLLDQSLFWPFVVYPSCWHTTEASVLSQESSHTVPHRLFVQISTLPSFGMLPPASRSWPVVQTAEYNRRKLCTYQLWRVAVIILYCFITHYFWNSVYCLWFIVIKPVNADYSSKFIALQMQGH